MKQKLFLFLFLILMVVVLAGLNAVSYVQKEKTPDSEFAPNRSTYNVGTTGTQALYSLLSETGRKVVRWQEPPAALNTETKNKTSVFVVIGTVRREFTEPEGESLLRWVSYGGRLVIIDREPRAEFATTTANWQIEFDGPGPLNFLSLDPADQNQMTADTPAIKPAQPTVFTHSVNAVQPSRLAASIGLRRFEGSEIKTGTSSGYESDDAPPPPKARPTFDEYENDDAPPPPPKARPTYDGYEKDEFSPDPESDTETRLQGPVRLGQSTSGSISGDDYSGADPQSQSAPVVHFASGSKNLVVEAPFGQGKIVYLADPYVVSNAGIGLVDNAQLAINILSAGTGTIAFDEYHQGYGADDNKFLEFFAGTPVVAIFLQGIILVGFIFFSQSRRFARAVPEPEPDRLSKLEYVSAMAELQERTSAFDLAIENIYNDFRRRASRLLGADNYAVRYDELAALIAERTGVDRSRTADTLHKCEEIIRGELTNKREVLRLSAELRELEQKLGLTRNRTGKA